MEKYRCQTLIVDHNSRREEIRRKVADLDGITDVGEGVFGSSKIHTSEIPGVQFHNSITISDDRSVPEKTEEQNLLALRNRSNISPSALQDYQMQLKLLEQQNKTRLYLSRRELDTPSTGESMTDDVLKIPKLIDSQTTTNKRHDMELDFTNSSNDDISRMDAVELQHYIERLQMRAIQLKATTKNMTSSRYQTFYRILHISSENSTENLSSTFFDPPECVIGQGSARMLRCKIPLSNFDLYLEQNKDVSFIVYRTYVESDAVAVSNSHITINGEEIPVEINESIQPVAQDLITALETILQSREEYEDLLATYRSTDELHAPYLFMYHNRKDLDMVRNNLNQFSQNQFALFSEYVIQNYGSMYETADSLFSRGKTSPECIKYLFKPGDLLVKRYENDYRGWVACSWPREIVTKRMSRSEAETLKKGVPIPLYCPREASKKNADDMVLVHHLSIAAWHWDFDGNFQRQNDILEFTIQAEENQTEHRKKAAAHHDLKAQDKANQSEKDQVAIEELIVFPMKYASTEIVNKLRRRGRTFWKCRSRKFVSYQEQEMDSIKNPVEERYMIDLKTYRSLHRINFHDSNGLKDELGPEAIAREDPPDDQFELLLPLKIKGYSLRRKKWYDLVADRVVDVKWNKEAFQQVVIDRKAKDLIRALVSNQLAAEVSTDLIAGKGNGLILLLHGSPGTGKTLTAESVAEIAEKPLYRVTCGDVGTEAEDVEKYLDSVFHLGKLWGCVVLLDEADVFLEQRSLEDLQRNALVSVFLRVLEYYEGILVLTSNRVGIFDEAFKSRIQLALHFPILGPYQRLRIWENFINRLESFQEDSVDIADLRNHFDDLKEEKMNGRQIRNVITTARQYTEWKNTKLTYEHLSDVIDVSGRFDKYLVKLNGGLTQDEVAEDEGRRLAR